jgi:hypothetical protein
VTVVEDEMTSNHTFFAHRLGVDCEKGSGVAGQEERWS